MPTSRDEPLPPEPDDLEPGNHHDDAGGDSAPWQPGQPWEPEPEDSPWRDWEREREREGDTDRPRPAPRESASGRGTGRPAVPGATGTRPGHLGPAYLAVAAWLVVSLGMGLVTIGLHARLNHAKSILAFGSLGLLAGLSLLAIAAWMVGTPKRR